MQCLRHPLLLIHGCCLQAHLGRVNVGGDMSLDQKRVITTVSRLLHACVDVVTSSSWLNPAIAAMELCQMVTQGMWDSESTLMQLPHMTADTAARCAKAEVTDVFALSDMEVSFFPHLASVLNVHRSAHSVACMWPSVFMIAAYLSISRAWV